MVRCRDGALYTGVSMDPLERVKVHNLGKGAKYTRSRLPVELVWARIIGNKGAALKEEIRIKRLSRAEKLELVKVFTT